MDIKASSAAMANELIEFRRDLHRHPELSMKEFRTTDRLAAELGRLGVAYRRCEPTGLFADLPGRGPGKMIALRAEIDALPIEENSGESFSSEEKGVMHACGHDSHAAMLLGAVKLLLERRGEYDGTVRILFQPAEENGEGALTMLAQGAAEGVENYVGMHVCPGVRVGAIGFCPGPQLAASDEFTIRVKGRGSHGAMPQFGVDAVLVASEIVLALQSIVSRRLDPLLPAVITVGKFNAGVRYNVMAGEAVLEGTTRYFQPEVQTLLRERMHSVAEGVAQAHGATAELDYKCGLGPVINDVRVTRIARAAAAKVVADPALDIFDGSSTMGSDDFGNFSVLKPSTSMLIGVGGTYPVHNASFTLDERAIPVGAAVFAQVALDLLSSNE